MKRYKLAFTFLVIASSVQAQMNYNRASFGLGGGVVHPYTDVREGAFTGAFAANLDFHLSLFITAGLEIQSGSIKGGGKNGAPDIHGRKFHNLYNSFVVNTKFRAGEFTNYYYNDFLNYTKGLYLGVGLGAIRNDLSGEGGVIREKLEPDNTIYPFPGKTKSTDIVLPLNIGIDFYFPNGAGDIRYIVNINYQTNIDFGEGLDGYNDPKSKFRNLAPDMYNFLSIGAKYTFGPKGISKKTIR